MSYFADVRALARKDLLLELRARDTLPAMLLFVLAVFVVFHFALPSGSSDLAASGLLWVAIVFTALLGLGRAFVPEREQRVLDGLVLAPCDRSAIWLAKGIAVLAFLAAAEVVALPAYALFFHGLDAATVAAVVLADLGICSVGAFVGAMATASRARELLLPLLFLPLAIPIVIGGVGASVTDEPGRYLGLLGLCDALFSIIFWASFEYVVTEYPPAGVCCARPDIDGGGACADLFLRPGRRGRTEPEDLLRARPDCVRRLRMLCVGRLEGAATSLEARRERGPGELCRHPSRRDLRRLDTGDRFDLGAVQVGSLVGLERGPARAVPRPVPLLLRVLHVALLACTGPAAGEPERGVRALRCRARADQHPGDSTVRAVHPSGRVRQGRSEHGRVAVPDVLRRRRRDAHARGHALSPRACRQAARSASA